MKKMLVLTSMFFMATAHFCNAAQSFNFPSLPRDTQYEIMLKYIGDEIASLPTGSAKVATESLKVAADKIRNLAIVNKDLNSVINEPVFCLKLIKKLAQTFNTSDDKAAYTLGTQSAKERFTLQNNFVLEVSVKRFSQADFDNFIERGVDLEWIDGTSRTPLMAAVKNNNLAAVRALIKKGVNVNYVNNFGESALCEAIGAVGREKIEAIKILLDAGADLTTEVIQRKLRGPRSKEVRTIIEDAQKRAQ